MLILEEITSTRMAEVLVKKNSSLAFQGFYEFILPIVETHANVAASLAERKRCNHLIGFYRNINSKIDDNDCDGYRTLDSNLDQGEVQGGGSHRSERYKTTNEELGTCKCKVTTGQGSNHPAHVASRCEEDVRCELCKGEYLNAERGAKEI
ncbi:hypothetical protein SESBI_43408 [Sesbania bispinosa]|nr:hypothetical protein SESBI_43408 [Sesbania bispinosa]